MDETGTADGESASGILKEIIRQDKLYWNDSGEVRRRDCFLLYSGKKIDKIHDHYRWIGPECCPKLFIDTHENEGDRRCSVVWKQSAEMHAEGAFSESICISKNCTNAASSLECDEDDETDLRTSSCWSVHTSSSSSSSMRSGSIFAQTNDGQENELGRRPSDRDLYVDVLRCCDEPTLSKWNISTPKDKFRSDADRLSSYAQEIFNLQPKFHNDYLRINKRKGQSQEQSLRQQLYLLEHNLNPYYNRENFQDQIDYKTWQDSEREEIIRLLGNSVWSSSRGDDRDHSRKDRCKQYKRLVEKVIWCDFAKTDRATPSPTSSQNLGPESHTFGYTYALTRLVSKKGRRLLVEFAERFRITEMTRSCFHLLVLREYINISDVRVCDAITDEMRFIIDLLQSGSALCVSELQSLKETTGILTSQVETFVLNLLTEWKPTSALLNSTLKMAEVAFALLEELENVDSEWPECLSDWLEQATIKKYESFMKNRCKGAHELFFVSIVYALDVLKMLRSHDHAHDLLSYETVLMKYVPDYQRVSTSAIYKAVHADESVLEYTLSLNKSLLPNHQTADKDSLDLQYLALAYKLAELDSTTSCGQGNSNVQQRHHNLSWRIAYHPIAMHWLDILSCHMRNQIFGITKADKLVRRVGSGFSALEMEKCVNFRDPAELEQNTLSAKSEDNVSNNKHSSMQHCQEGTIIEGSRKRKCSSSEFGDNVNEARSKSFKTSTTSYAFVQHSSKDISSSETTSFHSCPLDSSNHEKEGKFVQRGCADLRRTSSCTDQECFRSPYSKSTSTETDDLFNLPGLISVGKPSNVKRSLSAEKVQHQTSCSSENSIAVDDCEFHLSSSLADFTSIITRFTHAVTDIANSIYEVPFEVNEGENEEFRYLQEVRNHFVLKSLEAFCSAVKQYMNLILRKNLSRLSKSTGVATVGRKLFSEVMSRSFCGDFNLEKSFMENCDLEDFDSEEAVCHFNNMLVLDSGLSYAMEQIEKLLVSHSTGRLEEEYRNSQQSTEIEPCQVDVTSSDFKSHMSNDENLTEANDTLPCEHPLKCDAIVIVHLKDNLKSHVRSSLNGLRNIIIHHISKDFRPQLAQTLVCVPNAKTSIVKQKSVELLATLHRILENFEKTAFKEGMPLLFERFWSVIIENFRTNAEIILTSNSVHTKKQSLHQLRVFKSIADVFRNHLLVANCSIDALMELNGLKTTLVMLELLTMPTPSLIDIHGVLCSRDSKMDGRCESESNFLKIAALSALNLLDRKTFTGAELLKAVEEVTSEADIALSEDEPKAKNFCNKLLRRHIVQFVFTKRRLNTLPNLVSGENTPVRKGRSCSVNTRSSQQSSIVTDGTESNHSETSETPNRDFSSDGNTYYRFSDRFNKLSLVRQAFDLPGIQFQREERFIIDILLDRSRSDKKAKDFLTRKGYLHSSVFGACLSCFA